MTSATANDRRDPVAKGNSEGTPLWGIAEWMCWYSNYDKPVEGPEAIDVCVALHADALTRSRELKPGIPELGLHGIPIRDEIELELALP